MKPKSLQEWDVALRYKTGDVALENRQIAGAWLPIIPSREEWDAFLSVVKLEWGSWLWNLGQHDLALVVLYQGTAFFYYEGGAFWEAFAHAVGEAEIPSPSRQEQINHEFARVCGKLGLPILRSTGRVLYVGSAVYQVGIPIKMWDGFLRVCEWAWFHDAWEKLSDDEWKQKMGIIALSQQRLQRFLCENRQTAIAMIREMLDVRRLLAENPNWALNDIAAAVFLRREYFDEVPETADFLREKDPDSLFRDRPRLFWDAQSSAVRVGLPAVDPSKLPAQWRFGSRCRDADAHPVEMTVNSDAFISKMVFDLECKAEPEKHTVAGIGDWALFDEARRRFIKHDREVLPLSTYAIVSKQELAVSGDGWIKDEDDPQENLRFSFPPPDGSTYFVTKLLPERNKAKLTVDGRTLLFQQRQKVHLRIFSGSQSHRFRFAFDNSGVLRVEEWPRIVLEMPVDFVPEEKLDAEFPVFLDGERATGRWRFDDEGELVNYYFWDWGNPPLPQFVAKPKTVKGLESLSSASLAPAPEPWLGLHAIWVESERIGRIPFGTRSSQMTELLARTGDDLWPPSAGDYLVWILLAQVQDEATWEEMKIARNVIAAFQSVSLSQVYYHLRKIEQAGMARKRGRSWTDFENRIRLDRSRTGAMVAKYAGLPSALYPILRDIPPIEKPKIPRPERGRPPHLEVHWAATHDAQVRHLCAANKIRTMKESLWTR